MKTYMIGYDSGDPGADHSELFQAIVALSGVSVWHCLDTTWLVKSASTAREIKNALKPYIHNNDRLLVALLSGEASWSGFSAECAEWLKTNL